MKPQLTAERNCPGCENVMEAGPHPERRNFYAPSQDEPPFFTCPNCGEWREIKTFENDTEARKRRALTEANDLERRARDLRRLADGVI